MKQKPQSCQHLCQVLQWDHLKQWLLNWVLRPAQSLHNNKWHCQVGSIIIPPVHHEWHCQVGRIITPPIHHEWHCQVGRIVIPPILILFLQYFVHLRLCKWTATGTLETAANTPQFSRGDSQRAMKCSDNNCLFFCCCCLLIITGGFAPYDKKFAAPKYLSNQCFLCWEAKELSTTTGADCFAFDFKHDLTQCTVLVW